MNQLLNFLKASLGGVFVVLASIASIGSILILCFSDKDKAIIALSFLVLFLVSIWIKLFFFFNSLLKNRSADGYERIAIHINYRTLDGKSINYEVQRYIQCKHIIMTNYIHKFNWTGTTPALGSFKSKTMDVEKISYTEKGSYDELSLKFKKPLTYNKYYLIHLNALLEDETQISAPHVEHKVSDAMQYIEFTIELLYYDTSKQIPPAKLTRGKNNTDVFVSELVEMVPFDLNTKSYRCDVVNPLPQHTYRLTWVRQN